MKNETPPIPKQFKTAFLSVALFWGLLLLLILTGCQTSDAGLEASLKAKEQKSGIYSVGLPVATVNIYYDVETKQAHVLQTIPNQESR